MNCGTLKYRESLTVLLQHLLQPLTGEKDAALDGAEGEIHFLGDLVVFVPRHMHGERYTIVVGK